MTQRSGEQPIGRRWYIFAALGSGIFLASLNGSIVGVVLPTLMFDLDTDFALVQWVVLSYSLTQTTIILGVGRLGDIMGKKPIFLSGTVVFVIGSILCGLAPNIEFLLLFRVLQAIGGALATALSMGIITETFPASERGKALGLFSMTVSIGGIVGPLLGGILLDILSWRWIFFVGLPFSCASFILTWRYMPSTRPPGGQQFDWGGAIAFFIGLLTLMLFLTLGERNGYQDPAILSLLAVAILALVVFIRTENRVEQPLLDLRLFQSSLFSLNLSMRVISFIVFGGISLLFPFYLRNLLALEPTTVGLLLTVTSVFFGLASPIAGTLSDRFGFRLIAGIGLVMMAFGCFTISTLTAETSIIGYILRVLPLGLGMGIFQSPNNSAVMGSVPRARLGVVSGVNVIARTLGGTCGVAALGALWVTRVAIYAGPDFSGGVTEAAIAVQIAGLRDVSLAAMAMLGVALVLSAWGLLQFRRTAQPASIG